LSGSSGFPLLSFVSLLLLHPLDCFVTFDSRLGCFLVYLLLHLLQLSVFYFFRFVGYILLDLYDSSVLIGLKFSNLCSLFVGLVLHLLLHFSVSLGLHFLLGLSGSCGFHLLSLVSLFLHYLQLSVLFFLRFVGLVFPHLLDYSVSYGMF